MTGDPIDATQSKPSSSSSEVPFTAQESNVDSDSRLDTHPRYQARVEDEFDHPDRRASPPILPVLPTYSKNSLEPSAIVDPTALFVLYRG
ncbi:MAG: hypothetical protein TREMPRED_004238 [Tremellales sp. Tagirdzhanova-0007]|nr:MAG: hypothetical protein TREMPRED_004238 [Tremellales sp. Tagirdzhanova-0007]